MGLTIGYLGRLKSYDLLPLLMKDLEEFCRQARWKSKVFSQEDRYWHENLSGLILYPPNCPSLSLIVDQEGKFVNTHVYDMYQDKEFWNVMVKSLHHNARLLQNLAKPENQEEQQEPEETEIDEKVLPISFFSLNLSGKKPGEKAQPNLVTESCDLDKFLAYNFTNSSGGGAHIHIAIIELLDYIKQNYASHFEINDSSGYYEHRDLDQLKRTIDLTNYDIQIFQKTISQISSKGKIKTIGELIEVLSSSLKEAKSRLN